MPAPDIATGRTGRDRNARLPFRCARRKGSPVELGGHARAPRGERWRNHAVSAVGFFVQNKNREATLVSCRRFRTIHPASSFRGSDGAGPRSHHAACAFFMFFLKVRDHFAVRFQSRLDSKRKRSAPSRQPPRSRARRRGNTRTAATSDGLFVVHARSFSCASEVRSLVARSLRAARARATQPARRARRANARQGRKSRGGGTRGVRGREARVGASTSGATLGPRRGIFLARRALGTEGRASGAALVARPWVLPPWAGPVGRSPRPRPGPPRRPPRPRRRARPPPGRREAYASAPCGGGRRRASGDAGSAAAAPRAAGRFFGFMHQGMAAGGFGVPPGAFGAPGRAAGRTGDTSIERAAPRGAAPGVAADGRDVQQERPGYARDERDRSSSSHPSRVHPGPSRGAPPPSSTGLAMPHLRSREKTKNDFARPSPGVRSFAAIRLEAFEQKLFELA